MQPQIYYFLLFSFFIISCDTSNKDNKELFCSIDTAVIEEKAFSEDCFSREASVYPLVKGVGDWTKINKLIKDTIYNFIEQSRQDTECLEDEPTSLNLGWATTRFEILNNDENVVSIALLLTSGFGGGNMWIPSVNTINIDPENQKIIPKHSLVDTNLNRAKINRIIFEYFYRLFPDDAEESIGKEFLKTTREFEDLEYGVRNDSLMLLLPAYPGGHVSYTVYTIPITRINRR